MLMSVVLRSLRKLEICVSNLSCSLISLKKRSKGKKQLNYSKKNGVLFDYILVTICLFLKITI